MPRGGGDQIAVFFFVFFLETAVIFPFDIVGEKHNAKEPTGCCTLWIQRHHSGERSSPFHGQSDTPPTRRGTFLHPVRGSIRVPRQLDRRSAHLLAGDSHL